MLSWLIMVHYNRGSCVKSLLRVGSPLRELLLVQVSELVDLRSVASGNALCKFNESTDCSSARQGVLGSLCGDLDEDDTGVLWATIVLAITEITEPCLERGRVVLSDPLSVGLKCGLAGDGCPFARGIEESEVDVRVRFEVIGLARFGVGVEDKINAVALLDCGSVSAWDYRCGDEAYLGCKGHATRNEQTAAGNAGGHHAELALLNESDEGLDLVLERLVLLLVLGDIRVGSLATSVCI